MNTEELAPEAEGPRVDRELLELIARAVSQQRPNVSYQTNGSPRWRVILEVLIVSGVVALITAAIANGRWETSIDDKLQTLTVEVNAIATVVKPRYSSD